VGTSGLVTILFTDLVGSTAHASTVGDPAADEMRRDHFASLREAVAATGGTEVKTIGDALMVSYAGAADALTGAATMQRAVDRHNRRLADGQTIAMRVGISAGDASFEDGDWFGTPVVEAARLCAAADGARPHLEITIETGEDVGMTGPFGTVVKGRELLASLDG
jgi:class 3 adenylate cyclase